ncbi:MAG: hypothetical protein ACR2IF_15330 [Terriglobales bacterium]
MKSNFRRFLTFSVLLWAVTMVGQANKPPADAPKYDLRSEVTVKGKVEEVQKVANAKGQVGIHLLVKTETATLEVRLCPNSFLDDMDVRFAKGDALTITGSKVKVEEKDVILAREIERGTSKIVLRDKEGVPVWLWLVKG